MVEGARTVPVLQFDPAYFIWGFFPIVMGILIWLFVRWMLGAPAS